MSEQGPRPDVTEPAPSPTESPGSVPQSVDRFGLTESNLPAPDGAAEAAEPVLQVPTLTCAGGLRP